MRREAQQRSKAIEHVVVEDLLTNKAIVERNKSWLEEEMSILASGFSITQPLVKMRTGFWDLVRTDPQEN